MHALTQAESHNVGNHTFHHPDRSKISTKESFAQELSQLEELYQQTTGQPMKKYYRLPQGKYSEANSAMAKEMGYHFASLDDLVSPIPPIEKPAHLTRPK